MRILRDAQNAQRRRPEAGAPGRRTMHAWGRRESGDVLRSSDGALAHELFVDEAVGLRVEFRKGRIDAELASIEEALERHDGHESGQALRFGQRLDAEPELLVPVVHGLHELVVVHEVGEQRDAHVGPVAAVGLEGLEPLDESRHERLVGTALEERLVALHLTVEMSGVVLDERGVERALVLEVVHARALAHACGLSRAVHGERTDAFLEDDAAGGGDDGCAGSEGLFTAHGKCLLQM